MWPRRFYPADFFAPRFFPQSEGAVTTGGTVTATHSTAPRVAGAHATAARVGGTHATSARVSGTHTTGG